MDVDAVVAGLSLAEKASLCRGSGFWHTQAIERAGIPRVMVTDGPHGLRKQPGDADHVGLSGSVPATCFPTASALASSFDTDLLYRVGEALGRECRAEQVGVLLGPGVNIKRSPLCGRNFEYFSEDPLVAGVLAAAAVRGVQSQGVGTSLKHFAANNQETDRLRVSADVDERTLREIYLPAFERVVTEAQPWTVMCSYNKINGTYASQHHWLLTEVLRDEWGFEGMVVSDWGAVADRVAALAAGLDLEMPPNLQTSDAQIIEAVQSGALDEAVLDTAVTRVLNLVDRTTTDKGDPLDLEAHHALARAAARDCLVLLRNDDTILPLTPEPGSTLAVIGEFARTPRYQGAGSSQVNPTKVETALDELTRAAEGVTVAFAAGFGLGTTADDESLAQEAVELASRAHTVVAFLGLPASDESEGFDRDHLDLPASQTALVVRLVAANPRLVVVLANGSAIRLDGWEHHAKAVLETWLGGQAAGGAIADVLLGTANPSGRLAETLPLRLEDNPSYLNFPGDSGHVRYGEGVFVGYRGYDALAREVSYPFGHGLSYTTFEYADLVVEQTGSHAAGDLAISVKCNVTNTGQRAGKEVVQLYVGAPDASVARPIRELKSFAKVDLAPGETTQVELMLGSRDLSYWSELHHRWVLEAGRFDLAVGASSRDLRLTTSLDVDTPPVAAPLDDSSSLQEWLADPIGGPLLLASIGASDAGTPNGVLGDAELLQVIGNFPLRRLCAFPGMVVDNKTLDGLLEQLGAQR
ncbi:beta-glucosidase [Kribbella orskensis]|uniref:Beta-glucosidase n=1 Tax=Kribbella orskensis TaxID=2512216 RepID=A0ABY2BKR2_9ACTN|nr:MULTISPECIES: glycoside hydrolase family 3 C-terminal domain-containing protein [Kribbella]TCN40524.1 beta-glucosidase [Kribbella sp. VKM Ac-2500]TCO23144.1 beta-glucosidase [Kribbella orskensis]